MGIVLERSTAKHHMGVVCHNLIEQCADNAISKIPQHALISSPFAMFRMKYVSRPSSANDGCKIWNKSFTAMSGREMPFSNQSSPPVMLATACVKIELKTNLPPSHQQTHHTWLSTPCPVLAQRYCSETYSWRPRHLAACSSERHEPVR